jgi:ATP-dependent phosphofructokinase / diphosphate-dependent phosphofructokinase
MKVAVLTGGGDCPGLNAVIRAIVRRAEAHQFEIMGVRDGWKGILENRHERLTRDTVSGILHVGGTILGTSRTNPFKYADGLQRIQMMIGENHIGAIIAIGGEDTLGVAKKLVDQGFKIVGVPKTIDNDLNGTDYTFGFDTAVSIATEAIDRLHSTAESHRRVMVVEVMGRHAGWIATYAGIAGGADVVLVPEYPVDLDNVAEHVQHRHAGGKNFSIVVVAEGARIAQAKQGSAQVDDFGHERLGGIGQLVAAELEKRTGYETRVTVLGHTQRGGSPSARDRVMATQFGVYACDMVARAEWGKMAALRGTEITSVDLAVATASLKTVDKKMFELAEVFFG